MLLMRVEPRPEAEKSGAGLNLRLLRVLLRFYQHQGAFGRHLINQYIFTVKDLEYTVAILDIHLDTAGRSGSDFLLLRRLGLSGARRFSSFSFAFRASGYWGFRCIATLTGAQPRRIGWNGRTLFFILFALLVDGSNTFLHDNWLTRYMPCHPRLGNLQRQVTGRGCRANFHDVD